MIKALWDFLRLWYLRLAASGLVPAAWYRPALPVPAGREGALSIEIVSHCWNYSHLLVYQLSSLVLHPPRTAKVTMTVFYAEEDAQTRSLLDFIAARDVPNVHWNWQALPRQSLFRRGIGRNQAALDTRADWIWFTDCDLVFGEGCLDGLNQALQGRTERLLYPRVERVTTLLSSDNPLLASDSDWRLREISGVDFIERENSRATGPLQITHGDVARALGYCGQLRLYMEPTDHFAKCHEDRAFRWLLGSQGEAIEVPAVYRIRHADKGRYRSGLLARVRRGIRELQG